LIQILKKHVICTFPPELAEKATYDAWGRTESDYRPARWAGFREDYRFTGKEEDVEVGLTYFGARYYSPYLGRWMSPDPLQVHGAGGDPNALAYVSGRLGSAVDPNGLDWVLEGEGTDSKGGHSAIYGWEGPGYPDGSSPSPAPASPEFPQSWAAEFGASGGWGSDFGTRAPWGMIGAIGSGSALGEVARVGETFGVFFGGATGLGFGAGTTGSCIFRTTRSLVPISRDRA
jgi:RHS repeat-associated protein